MTVALLDVAVKERSRAVPASAKVWGLPWALSAGVKDAVRSDGAVGANVTVIVHAAGEATGLEAEHVEAAWMAKPPALAPAIAMLLKSKAPSLYWKC